MFYGINSYQKQNILVLKIVKHLFYIEFELKKTKNRLILVIKKVGLDE